MRLGGSWRVAQWTLMRWGPVVERAEPQRKPRSRTSDEVDQGTGLVVCLTGRRDGGQAAVELVLLACRQMMVFGPSVPSHWAPVSV